MWYAEKMPQRNLQKGDVFGRLKPLTEPATGLIPRSNFANVADRLGNTSLALTGRDLPELSLAITATAYSLGGLGKVPLKFGTTRCQRADAMSALRHERRCTRR